jgi:hypothetical protein
MSRIALAFKSLHTNQNVTAMQRYVCGNDRDALARIIPVQRTSWSDVGHVLGEALAKLSAWTDEDRRLVHALAAAGLLGRLGDLRKIAGKTESAETE